MKDLRSFLTGIESYGSSYYRRVSHILNQDYDLSVLQIKLAQQGIFPTIYVPEIKGYGFPVVAGLYSDYIHLGAALDLTPAEIESNGKSCILSKYLQRLSNPISPIDVVETDAPVRECVLTGDEVNVLEIPIQKHAERNRGRFVTAGVTVLRDPDSGVLNAGIYRQCILGPNRITLNTVPGHDGARIIRRWHKAGQPAPVITFIGHHPATAMAAGYAYGKGRSELDLMGALLAEPLGVVPGAIVDLPIPARAEIVLEGVILPSDHEYDGPFSEAMGTYDKGYNAHVMTVHAINRRRDPIYQDLCPIHQEHTHVNILGREAIALKKIRETVPGVQALHIGPDGNVTKTNFYISIKKKCKDDGMNAADAVATLKAIAKFIVVVDYDIDVYHQPDVLWALTTRYSNTSQIKQYPNNITAIDATCPLDQSFPERALPPLTLFDSIGDADSV